MFIIFRSELETDGCQMDGFNINAVATALKAFFRELKSPLLRDSVLFSVSFYVVYLAVLFDAT